MIAQSPADIIGAFSYIGITLTMLVLPPEAVMPLSGYIASQGRLSLVGAIVAGTVGSVMGSAAIYLLARLLSPGQFESIGVKYGRLLGISSADIKRSEAWFDHHAASAVSLGRFIPGVATVVSIPAGLRRMRFSSFFLYTALGSTAWIIILTSFGYLLGDKYALIGRIAWYVGAGAAIVAVFFLIRWILLRRRGRASSADRHHGR